MQKLLLSTVVILATLFATAQIKTTQPPARMIERPVINNRVVTGPQADSIFTTDVSRAFDNMEQNIEVVFAKLKKEVKDDIAKLNEQIRQLPGKLLSLRKHMNRLESELVKIDQLQAKFMAMMDSIKRAPGGGLLNGDRAKMQQRMDSLSTQRISVHDQMNDANAKISMQMAANNEEKKNLQKQIMVLEQEMNEFDKQKAAMIAELRQQKQKVLAQLAKERQTNPQQYQSTINAVMNTYFDVLQQQLQQVGRRSATTTIIR